MLEFSKTKRKIVAVLFVAGFFFLGVYIGFTNQFKIGKVTSLVAGATEIKERSVDFSDFWKVWDLIDEKYPGSEKISDQERLYGAISGLLNSLDDPYSVFFKPDEAKLFEEDIAGSFIGVGMEVGIKNKVLTVIAPLKNTPAEKAGIKAGDKILKIDQTIASDLTIDQAIKLIRGEKGTTVILTIAREGEKGPKEVPIVRDTIIVPTLDTELRPDNIFVIKLYSFTANSTGLFRNALREFSQARTDKLLLDLRGNPGGYLSAAVNIASWFLPGGKVVVTEDYGTNKKPTVYRSKGYDVFKNNLKLVILIDGGSASASEIVAGAMQDHKRAILVGSQSFGKGSVQEVVNITTDTLLKITVAKWLTPNGNSITEKGLTPDYQVESAKQAGTDLQLNKAIELLNNWPGLR